LGATTREDHGAVIVSGVLDDGPAQAHGLYAGDELVAFDGFRVDNATFKERLAAKKPGERVRFDVFRRDRLRGVEVTLAPRPVEKWRIRPTPSATAEQRAAYQQWLGAEWTAGGDDDEGEWD
jgi:predicted metalloprotease with PDZ domain